MWKIIKEVGRGPQVEMGGTLLHQSSLCQTYPLEWSLQSRVWALTGLGKHMADAGGTLGGRRGDAGWEGAV